MPGVFISYRREDSAGHSGRLFDRLRAALGPDRVFMDVAGIEAGVDFVDAIEEAIGSCELVLAVIGPEWLTCTGPNGRQRLQDPSDFIRIEIASALKRKIRVIPVLVAGASMPTADALPEDLRPLTRRQTTELRDTRWDADTSYLTELVERVLGAKRDDAASQKPGVGPTSRSSPRVNVREESRRQRLPLRFALGMGLLTAATLLTLGWALGWFRPAREQPAAPAASQGAVAQQASTGTETETPQVATALAATPTESFPPRTSSPPAQGTASRGSLETKTPAPAPPVVRAARVLDAASVVAAASRAMGVDALTSITYAGTARNGAFGQSKSIGDPMGPVNLTRITEYTRTITFTPPGDPAALVSRATGQAQPPTVPGVAPPMPVVFNQNVAGTQASTNWNQALNIWTTPWGFLKGAAANNATVRQQGGQQLVSFTPPNLKSPSGQTYSVTGYINAQNLVTKVETRVDHAVVGDLLVEFEYSNYQNMRGVQVPARIVQKQAGLQTFDAEIKSATPNPSNLTALLTLPPPPGGRGRGRGGAPATAAGPPFERIGDGVFKIAGNYTSLAVDMGDHVLVVESGQSDARGLAVIAAAKQAVPNKPIRFVVNSHPHFDHASGLAAAVAEGATILTHNNNEQVLERLLSGPRTLIGDSLSKVTTRRIDVVRGVGDRDVRKGTNSKVVELLRFPNEHSDGMLMVYLPAEKVVWSADITVVNPNPGQLGVVRSAAEALGRLGLDYNGWIPAHPPQPDRPLTKADVMAALATK